MRELNATEMEAVNGAAQDFGPGLEILPGRRQIPIDPGFGNGEPPIPIVVRPPVERNPVLLPAPPLPVR